MLETEFNYSETRQSELRAGFNGSKREGSPKKSPVSGDCLAQDNEDLYPLVPELNFKLNLS